MINLTTRYSRLQLKTDGVQSLNDFSFKFILTNSSTKTQVFIHKGKFDDEGFSPWIDIIKHNRSIIYEIYYKEKLIQKLTAKAYNNKKNWSLFHYKTSNDFTKKIDENIKEIYLNDGEVAWYLIKSGQLASQWASRVFKKPLDNSDWNKLRINNPHLRSITPLTFLKPGQVVILSNSTTAKELVEYKRMAQQVQKNLEEMQEDKNYDIDFLAQNYELLYDFIGNKNSQIIPKEAFDKNTHPLTVKFNQEKNDTGFFEGKMVADAALTMIDGQVTKIYALHSELITKYQDANIKGTPNAAQKFSAFRQNNASLYNQLNQESIKDFIRRDQGIKTSNMRRILNQSELSRDSTYKGGIKDYVKRMREIGKIGPYLKGVGYLSLATDAITSTMNVIEATPEDRTRTAVVETAKVGTGIAAGAITGALIFGLATGGAGFVVIGVVAVSAPLAGKAASEVVGWLAGETYDIFIE